MVRSVVPSARTAAAFRQRIMGVDPRDRDRWANQWLGLDDLPDDGNDLPRGCVPYLPSSVDVLLRVIDRADITSRDVFVDVGSGVGRAMMLVHLLTGASAVGLEVQQGLATAARTTAARLHLDRVSTIHGDAAQLVGSMTQGSVFYFYCPFGADRVAQAMDALEPLARVRPLRLCFVDMPPPAIAWLREDRGTRDDADCVTVCSSQLHGSPTTRTIGPGGRAGFNSTDRRFATRRRP